MTIDMTPAFRYLDDTGVEIPHDLHARARNVGAVKAADLGEITTTYRNAITDALLTYFEGGIVTGPRNRFRTATAEAFFDAFYRGYADGSGGDTPNKNALDWLNARIQQEYGFIDELMTQVKELRDEEGEFDYFSWSNARAFSYTKTVASVYNAGQMYGMKGRVLVWHLGRTEVHCVTCASLDGTAHRASWYLARNYIPRRPGAGMDCGGYNCDCRLTTKNGEEVTI